MYNCKWSTEYPCLTFILFTFTENLSETAGLQLPSWLWCMMFAGKWYILNQMDESLLPVPGYWWQVTKLQQLLMITWPIPSISHHSYNYTLCMKPGNLSLELHHLSRKWKRTLVGAATRSPLDTHFPVNLMAKDLINQTESLGLRWLCWGESWGQSVIPAISCSLYHCFHLQSNSMGTIMAELIRNH